MQNLIINELPKEFIAKFDLTTLEGKEVLDKEILKYPQVECPVIHRFGPSLYIREIFLPKGALVTGTYHIYEHLNVFLKGKVQVINDDGSTTLLEAPMMFIGKPGRKIGLILEDVTWQNIYATTETDIEKLEAMLFKNPKFYDNLKQDKLESDKVLKEEDRLDFEQMLLETGWSAEEVQKMSDFDEDKIPFPMGSYQVAIDNSPINGKGLFASASFNIGDIIAPARLNGKRTPAGYIINHAKIPNAVVIKNDNGDLYIQAIDFISGKHAGEQGMEITLDYRQVLEVNKLIKGNS